MQRTYIQEKQKKLQQKSDFYTPSGIHIYFQEHFHNEEVDIEEAVSRLEAMLPHHLLSEVEMIIIGWLLPLHYHNNFVFILDLLNLSVEE